MKLRMLTQPITVIAGFFILGLAWQSMHFIPLVFLGIGICIIGTIGPMAVTFGFAALLCKGIYKGA